MGRAKITDEIKQELNRLYDGHMPVNSVAAILGISKVTVRTYLLHPRHIGYRRVTDEQIVEMNHLYHDIGLSMNQVSKKMKVSNSTVGNYIENPRSQGKSYETL